MIPTPPAQKLRLATEEPADLIGRPSKETPPRKWQDGQAYLPCQICKEPTRARHFVFEGPWSSKQIPLHMLCAKSETYLSSLKQQYFLFAEEAVDGLVTEQITRASREARDSILDMLSGIN